MLVSRTKCCRQARKLLIWAYRTRRLFRATFYSGFGRCARTSRYGQSIRENAGNALSGRPAEGAVELPGRVLAGINLLDTATHTWDLATATGQPATLPDDVALTALELLVAVLQAYVFASLTCVYLNDAIHPGH